jgi:hypothetical protein
MELSLIIVTSRLQRILSDVVIRSDNWIILVF